ncbi:MAG: glutamyl-tRNA reductase [Clostridia bacterium]
MNINMIGIDYNSASLDKRAVFTFTKSKSICAMAEILSNKLISGCVILSTCNRLEIWVSAKDNIENYLFETLCEIKNVDPSMHENIITKKSGDEAVRHLFELACGLKSQILGEDQILAQIKDALSLSHENGFSCNSLEVLFRTAITAAKKVKTNVVLTNKPTTAVDEVIIRLKNEYNLKDKTCMVVGNGIMGKLASQAFVNANAKVFVTVRQQYKHGKIEVVQGATAISYDERESFLKNCDIVISATSSPHLTLTKDMFKNITKPLVLVDLAVPRDIDYACKSLENLTLYDIDDFKIGSEEVSLAKEKASGIIEEEIMNFYDWQSSLKFTSKIQFIKDETSSDVNARLKKAMKKMDLSQTQCQELENRIDIAVQNSINRMLFELKNSLTHEEFSKCIEGLEKIYE